MLRKMTVGIRIWNQKREMPPTGLEPVCQLRHRPSTCCVYQIPPQGHRMVNYTLLGWQCQIFLGGIKK